MKLAKFTTVILLFNLVTLLVARADLSIIWNTDNYSAFDVTVSGVGRDPTIPLYSDPYSTNLNAGCAITLTSPSGLWEVSLYCRAFAGIGSEPYFVISTRGNVNFLGPPPNNGAWMATTGYGDIIPLFTPLPVDDGAFLENGPLVFYGWQGWQGVNITSTPDLYDASTWTWTSECYASGPSLVPEVRTSSLLLMGLLLLATQVRHLRQPAEIHFRGAHAPRVQSATSSSPAKKR